MSETTTDSALTITLKAGGGYDAPWLVVRADSPDDAVMKLDNLGDVIASTIAAANLLHGANNAAPVVQNSPQLAAVPAQAPAQKPSWGQQTSGSGGGGNFNAARLHPEGAKCGQCGGAVQYKSITARATGKTFELWTCPNQRSKGDGHYSEFVN